MTQNIFARSPDAERLHQELIVTPIGGVVTYLTLSDAIGKPVRGGTGALRTARLIAQRDDRMVFMPVSGVGLQRLTDEEIVKRASVETTHVRHHARRVLRKLGTADFVQLSEHSQMRAISIASVLKVALDLSSERSLHKVGLVASGRATELPLRETVKAICGL
jgi:hypothetical protein